MKIIYIIDQLFEAGTQHHLCQLVKGLKKSGYDVQVICLEDKGGPLAEELENQNIMITAFHIGAFYLPDSLKKLRLVANFLAKEKPDIVQTYLLKANLMGITAAGMAGVPVVLSTRRSLGYDYKPHHVAMLKFLDQWTTATIVNSQAIADITVKKENISPEKIYKIYNGVETDKFIVPENKSLKKEFNLPTDVPVVGIVANIRPVKGYEYLISAMALVLKNNKAHLLVVGNVYNNEDYFLQLKAKASNMGISEHITFKHECKDIPKALSVVDIAVLSSVSEGFSNTMLEYMAAGKPIVATSVGGNGEAIIDKESGLLVPAKDEQALSQGIIQILKTRNMAEKFAENARKRVVQEFSIQAMLDKYKKYYQDFLNKA